MQEVTTETAEQYANEIGALYLETSAKDDTNVHDIFVQLSKGARAFSAVLRTAGS